MKVIAIEEHFITPEVETAWAAEPDVDDPTLGFHAREPIGGRLRDLGEERLSLMAETGVDVQVLSLTTPGLHNLTGPKSIGLAQRTNDVLAAAIARNPEHFGGLATLPTAAPKEAARELERSIRELGMSGSILCGRTREKNLDHPDLWPVFECAAALGAPILIHPQVPVRAVREAYYAGFDDQINLALSAFGLGWHYEAGIQFLRMVLAGVFDRFPSLQVILGHWGEVVLFYLERFTALDRAAKLGRPIAQYMRENVYVTASGMFSKTYLQRTVEIMGIERILFSTDYPFQYRPGNDARRFVENAGLDDGAQAKFAHGNWERLTGSIPRS